MCNRIPAQVVTTPSSLKSLMLKTIENLLGMRDPGNPKRKALQRQIKEASKLFALLKDAVLVMDEVDMVRLLACMHARMCVPMYVLFMTRISSHTRARADLAPFEKRAQFSNWTQRASARLADALEISYIPTVALCQSGLGFVCGPDHPISAHVLRRLYGRQEKRFQDISGESCWCCG